MAPTPSAARAARPATSACWSAWSWASSGMRRLQTRYAAALTSVSCLESRPTASVRRVASCSLWYGGARPAMGHATRRLRIRAATAAQQRPCGSAERPPTPAAPAPMLPSSCCHRRRSRGRGGKGNGIGAPATFARTAAMAIVPSCHVASLPRQPRPQRRWRAQGS